VEYGRYLPCSQELEIVTSLKARSEDILLKMWAQDVWPSVTKDTVTCHERWTKKHRRNEALSVSVCV
jgi:hypothetical protein